MDIAPGTDPGTRTLGVSLRVKFAQEPVTGISEVQEPLRSLCLLGGEERNVQTLCPAEREGQLCSWPSAPTPCAGLSLTPTVT